MIWSETAPLVAIACKQTLFVLRCNVDVISAYVEQPTVNLEGGIEDAFELLLQTDDRLVLIRAH